MGGITAIVAPLHNAVVGIRAHHDDVPLPFCGGQGQAPVVLQQHHTLAGHLQCQLLVLLRGNDRRGNLSPLYQFVTVEVTQFEAGRQQASQTGVDLGLRYIAAFDGGRQILVFRTALQVGTAHHGFGRSGQAVLRHIMPTGQKVANGTAVACDESLEAPVVAQYMLLVAGIATAGITVDALVGAHHLCYVALLYQCLEGRQVGFPQVTFRQLLDVERVAVPLRTAMYGKVLGAGQELFILVLTGFAGQALSLQSVHHGQSHTFCQVWILAVGLLSASPSWVTEDVDVRRPERQSLIALYASRLLGQLVLGTRLVADSREDVVHQFVVPRGSHHGCDGEYRHESVTSDAVQGFVPPLECGDA